MDGNRSQRTEYLALARVALAATSWGFVPLLVRAVHASPPVIAFWRVALGGLAFFLFFLVRGRLGEIGRLDRRTMVGLGFLGVLLAVGWMLFFSAITLGTAVVLAVMTAAQKRVLRRVTPELVMFAQTVVAALFLLPVAVTLPGPATSTEWAALAVLGLGLTTVPFLLFLSGLRRVRADRVGVVTYAEPVSAVLLAAVFLHEPLTAATIIGGAAVVAGGLLVARLSPMSVPEAPAVDLSQR